MSQNQQQSDRQIWQVAAVESCYIACALKLSAFFS